MKRLYTNLAITGIKKNKQTYLPYLLTSIGLAAMYYIIMYLNVSPAVDALYGAYSIKLYLNLGFGVMNFFIFLVLLYTHSFLIKRRKKEFGLYNILGMGKRDIGKVLFMESLITALVTICGGVFFGILFSKAAELLLFKLLNESATFTFFISWESILKTAMFFLLISGVTFVLSLWEIHKTDPLELLHSEAQGEKAPKSNILVAMAGVILLTVAYTIAVRIKDPIAVVNIFFVAVLLVILATYLLFTAGSVCLCKLLKKNKKYYYKPAHFVSVSSMTFRMKRNGAGLASICILSTMVLVMMSFSTCIYTGMDEILKQICPREINARWNTDSAEHLAQMDDAITPALDDVLNTYGIDTSSTPINLHSASFTATLQNGVLHPIENYGYTDIYDVSFISLDDYNALTHANASVKEGEALIYCFKGTYNEDVIVPEGGKSLHVAGTVATMESTADAALQTIFPTLFVIIPNYDEYVASLSQTPVKLTYAHSYAADIQGDDKVITEAAGKISDVYNKHFTTLTEQMPCGWNVLDSFSTRSDYFGLYGGTFFLSILLGIIFLFSAVLIMYYKQITEGYEDQARFDIMQKVGMTKKEIRKSINSQILTVFFLPLLMAGLHLAFCFPFLTKMMYIFNISNTRLLFMTTCSVFLVFSLFYIITYLITSRSYYRIVASMQR